MGVIYIDTKDPDSISQAPLYFKRLDTEVSNSYISAASA